MIYQRYDQRFEQKSHLPLVFILAGGLGSRLGALCKDKPKAMLEVAGQPFVAHQLTLLKRRGVKKIVICTGHLGHMIENYVGDGASFGLEVRYSSDGSRLLGTGGSIKHALKSFPDVDEFGVTYGDSYLDINFFPAYKSFLRREKGALMTVLRNRNRWGVSNVRLSDDRVVSYIKEPVGKSFEYIDYGFSFLSPSAFQQISEESFDLSVVWQSLIAKGLLFAHPVPKRFYEIGTRESLAETEAMLIKLYLNNPMPGS